LKNQKGKLKVIKKVVKTPCYRCSEVGGTPTKRSKCGVCNGTGKYEETMYYHIVTVNGKKVCFSGDTIK